VAFQEHFAPLLGLPELPRFQCAGEGNGWVLPPGGGSNYGRRLRADRAGVDAPRRYGEAVVSEYLERLAAQLAAEGYSPRGDVWLLKCRQRLCTALGSFIAQAGATAQHLRHAGTSGAYLFVLVAVGFATAASERGLARPPDAWAPRLLELALGVDRRAPRPRAAELFADLTTDFGRPSALAPTPLAAVALCERCVRRPDESMMRLGDYLLQLSAREYFMEGGSPRTPRCSDGGGGPQQVAADAQVLCGTRALAMFADMYLGLRPLAVTSSLDYDDVDQEEAVLAGAVRDLVGACARAGPCDNWIQKLVKRMHELQLLVAGSSWAAPCGAAAAAAVVPHAVSSCGYDRSYVQAAPPKSFPSGEEPLPTHMYEKPDSPELPLFLENGWCPTLCEGYFPRRHWLRQPLSCSPSAPSVTGLAAANNSQHEQGLLARQYSSNSEPQSQVSTSACCLATEGGSCFESPTALAWSPHLQHGQRPLLFSGGVYAGLLSLASEVADESEDHWVSAAWRRRGSASLDSSPAQEANPG